MYSSLTCTLLLGWSRYSWMVSFPGDLANRWISMIYHVCHGKYLGGHKSYLWHRLELHAAPTRQSFGLPEVVLLHKETWLRNIIMADACTIANQTFVSKCFGRGVITPSSQICWLHSNFGLYLIQISLWHHSTQPASCRNSWLHMQLPRLNSAMSVFMSRARELKAMHHGCSLSDDSTSGAFDSIAAWGKIMVESSNCCGTGRTLKEANVSWQSLHSWLSISCKCSCQIFIMCPIIQCWSKSVTRETWLSISEFKEKTDNSEIRRKRTLISFLIGKMDFWWGIFGASHRHWQAKDQQNTNLGVVQNIHEIEDGWTLQRYILERQKTLRKAAMTMIAMTTTLIYWGRHWCT